MVKYFNFFAIHLRDVCFIDVEFCACKNIEDKRFTMSDLCDTAFSNCYTIICASSERNATEFNYDVKLIGFAFRDFTNNILCNCKCTEFLFIELICKDNGVGRCRSCKRISYIADVRCFTNCNWCALCTICIIV